MKNFETFKKDIERELMVKIIIGLKYGSVSQAKAQELAKEYLLLMNTKDSESLFRDMGSLVNKYTEMLDVYLNVASVYFNQQKDELLKTGRNYMQQMQYDAAATALKGGLTAGRRGY